MPGTKQPRLGPGAGAGRRGGVHRPHPGRSHRSAPRGRGRDRQDHAVARGKRTRARIGVRGPHHAPRPSGDHLLLRRARRPVVRDARGGPPAPGRSPATSPRGRPGEGRRGGRSPRPARRVPGGAERRPNPGRIDTGRDRDRRRALDRSVVRARLGLRDPSTHGRTSRDPLLRTDRTPDPRRPRQRAPFRARRTRARWSDGGRGRRRPDPRAPRIGPAAPAGPATPRDVRGEPLLRAGARQGAPSPGSRDRSVPRPLPVPDTLQQLLGARIAALPASATHALLPIAATTRPTEDLVLAAAAGRRDRAVAGFGQGGGGRCHPAGWRADPFHPSPARVDGLLVGHAASQEGAPCSPRGAHHGARGARPTPRPRDHEAGSRGRPGARRGSSPRASAWRARRRGRVG